MSESAGDGVFASKRANPVRALRPELCELARARPPSHTGRGVPRRAHTGSAQSAGPGAARRRQQALRGRSHGYGTPLANRGIELSYYGRRAGYGIRPTTAGKREVPNE